MITKRTFLYFIIALNFCCVSDIYSNLTTLQFWDPSPIFSANDSMMPPNSHFLDLLQARYKDEKPNKNRMFGINLTGFVQASVTARGYNGCATYGSDCGTPQNGFEMGDFRGTMYPMGLFLGVNPNNGYNIWAGGTVSSGGVVTPGVDTGLVSDITAQSIVDFDLPECLEKIALNLAGFNGCTTPPTCAAQANALVFNSNVPAATTLTGTSIFHADSLARDTIYFGAFSLPITYKKQGFRFEANVCCTDYIGLTIQSGIVNMKQKFVPEYTGQANDSQTNLGPYSISNIQGVCPTTTTIPSCTPAALSNLYTNLNSSSAAAATPNLAAQSLFNANICNNLADILDPSCGSAQGVYSFDKYSMEDIRVFLTLKKSYDPHRYTDKDDSDDSWPDMIFTPYLVVAGSCPVSETTNYKNILSLPFGNNGHPSLGAMLGMTFDFTDTIEVGFEGGATYFFAKSEFRPFPTHKLQRLLYPFATNVKTQPGTNWHANAMMSAYQFMPHVSFWLTYEFIEHRQDCFTVCDKEVAKYFVPSVLENRSDWRAQFFNAGLTFDIQPGMQASFVWQQPISPRNAYVPVSVMGSLNFMF